MSSSRVPDATIAAGATPGLRRRRPLTWDRVVRAVAPYALLLPALVVIAAVLLYPLYKLGTLSLQQYGLFELIQHQGKWIGFDNFRSVLGDSVFWDTLERTVIFTVA